MAVCSFIGAAQAVAQVAVASITAYDTGTTYKVTIGGVTVSVVGSGGTVSTTATALVAALNASTHPYFAAITWTANATAGAVTGTADTAGCPFVAVSSVSGGTGTFGAFSDSTACSGPNFWSVAANWSGGAVPVDGDDIVIASSSTPICWGLDQSSVDPASLRVDQTYTGKIGLDYRAFATSASGATTNSTVPEYRENYLLLGTITKCDLGYPSGVGTPSGCSRLLLSAISTAWTVHNTAAASADTGRPAFRLLSTGGTSVITVRLAPGGVGVAAEEPGETSDIEDLIISDTSTSSQIVVGAGVTWDDLVVAGGSCLIGGAADVASLEMTGGTVTTEGAWKATAVNLRGGTLRANNLDGSAVVATTLNLYGGTLDMQASLTARTITTLNLYDGTLRGGSHLTITTLADPAENYTLKITRP